jgi:hypothetical protein
MLSQPEAERVRALLSDKLWRLNNLYTITDKGGKVVRFKLNHVQQAIFNSSHPYKVILKSRQHGVSTYAAIDCLDTALIQSNVTAAIIAQTEKIAQGIFRKIKFAYERLPQWLKDQKPIVNETLSDLRLGNGSHIYVSITPRGGTNQWLHISEYGYISAHTPDRAREIKSGALNTVHMGHKIMIESTAEGTGGEFHEVCNTAMRLKEYGASLTGLDPEFFFFPWYVDEKNVLEPIGELEESPELKDYLDNLPCPGGLTPSQRFWYAKKLATQGESMYSEFPSTPQEAFASSASGAYYREQFKYLRANDRLTTVPWDPQYPVYTAWDLGGTDYTSIWYFQDKPKGLCFIRYYENFNAGWDVYVKEITRHPYTYAKHLLPHDGDQKRPVENGIVTAKIIIERLGLQNVFVVRVAKSRSWEIINKCQPALLTAYFDQENCALGIERLESYRRKWDTRISNWSDEHLHNESSHAADAFRTAVIGLEDGNLKVTKPYHVEVY